MTHERTCVSNSSRCSIDSRWYILAAWAVDVSKFSNIRVVADERVGSPTNIGIRLTITEDNELVAQLDTFVLTPHSQITRVYEVPGTKLSIFGDAIGGAVGKDSLDVLVYGN